MKRILLLSVILFAANFSIFSLENKIEKYFSFSITPQFEINNGMIKEYVYEEACKNTDHKLSELDWHISTVSLFNLQADFNIMKYAALGFSATFGVPQRTDFMQDYDWENSIGDQLKYPQWLNDDPTENTSFSEHVNHLDKFINFKAKLGGNIYLPAKIKITPYLAYQFEFIKFSASEGAGKYKWNNYQKYSFTGKVISYEQEMNSFLFGLSLMADTIPRTSIKLNFEFSPKMTNLNAIDYHLTRSTAFNDRFKKISLINSDITLQYRFTENHKAGFSGRIQYIPLAQGNTYQGKISSSDEEITVKQWDLISSYGGTERFIWSFGFNYSFSL